MVRVLTPAKVCAAVLTSPLFNALAFGMLKVCVDVALDMLKSEPVVPVAKV